MFFNIIKTARELFFNDSKTKLGAKNTQEAIEKFYEMDFKKITPRPPMGARVFDLQQILGRNEMPEVSQIAKMLSEKTWE